jgi:hypothetical protein
MLHELSEYRYVSSEQGDRSVKPCRRCESAHLQQSKRVNPNFRGLLLTGVARSQW